MFFIKTELKAYLICYIKLNQSVNLLALLIKQKIIIINNKKKKL